MQQVLTRCSPGAHQVLARCSPGARQVLTRCSSGAHSRAHRAAPMGVLLTTKWKGCLGQVGEREGVVTVNGVQRWGAKCVVLAPDAEVPERGGLEIALTSTLLEAAACSIQSSTYPYPTSLTTITHPTHSSVVSPGGLDAAPIPTHHHPSHQMPPLHAAPLSTHSQPPFPSQPQGRWDGGQGGGGEGGGRVGSMQVRGAGVGEEVQEWEKRCRSGGRAWTGQWVIGRWKSAVGEEKEEEGKKEERWEEKDGEVKEEKNVAWACMHAAGKARSPPHLLTSQSLPLTSTFHPITSQSPPSPFPPPVFPSIPQRRMGAGSNEAAARANQAEGPPHAQGAMRQHVLAGLKEVGQAVHSGRVKCVVLAANVERCLGQTSEERQQCRAAQARVRPPRQGGDGGGDTGGSSRVAASSTGQSGGDDGGGAAKR
ncbi:unnamed protein product [Closterium sp. Naga37s-1]|nr:unnamed protein product [Closterium sp. Naga37s-1]